MNPVQEQILNHQRKAGAAGTCVQWCIEELSENPGEEFRDFVQEQSTPAVIRKEWAILNGKSGSRKAKGGQTEMMLCGLPCPNSISYRDEFIPGGWRTVLVEAGASVYQLVQLRDAHRKQRIEFDEADDALDDLTNKAIERADGDLNKPLYTLSDDFFGEVG